MAENEPGKENKEKQLDKKGYRAEVVSAHSERIDHYVNEWLDVHPNIDVNEMTLSESGKQIDVAFLYRETEPVENKYHAIVISAQYGGSINNYVNKWLGANPNIDIERMAMGSSNKQIDIIFLYKEKGPEIK
ncbi:MAG: hypothetical protein ABIJ05_03050 [Patescibacteria group bacterium]